MLRPLVGVVLLEPAGEDARIAPDHFTDVTDCRVDTLDLLDEVAKVIAGLANAAQPTTRDFVDRLNVVGEFWMKASTSFRSSAPNIFRVKVSSSPGILIPPRESVWASLRRLHSPKSSAVVPASWGRLDAE